MSEKPGKRLVIHSNAHRDRTPPVPTRLVSKGQYLKTLGEKGVTHVAGAFFGLLGVSFFLISLFSLYGCFSSGSFSKVFIFIAVVSLILSLGAFCGCKSFFTSAQEIETVAPITRHNTGHLPEAETLVRASNLPPSHQQAELLRAAQTGQETPAEELLRATQGNRDNAS